MDRTINSQVQHCLSAGSLACALIALSFAACAPTPDRLASIPFRLGSRQVARLTARHTWFCAGRESLRVTLTFSDGEGRTVVKKEAVLRCGDSAQLDLSGEKAPQGSLTAHLDVRPPSANPPQAEVEVITPSGPGRESSVVYGLRLRAR